MKEEIQKTQNDIVFDDGSMYIIGGLAIVVGIIIVSYISFIHLAPTLLQ